MNTPVTQEELDTAEKVIQELLTFNEEHEPQALTYIGALREVLDNWRPDAEEAFTVPE